MKRVLVAVFVLGSLQANVALGEEKSCHERKDLVGDCFRFRGRLALYNGGHALWIWQVGAKHRYWVVNDASLEKLDLDWDHYYWGDFDACPVTKFKDGSAQGICAKPVGQLNKTKRK